MITKRLILLNLLLVVLFGLFSFAEAAPEWQATIWVTSGDAKNRLELGADPTATDGFDKAWDSYAMLGGSLRAFFPRPDWHPVFQQYWRDIRAKAPGKPTEWTFVIESDKVNTDVTLTWDLSLMPDGYPISLTDDSNGQSVSMLANASYSFTYSAARNFRVSVYTPSEPPPDLPPVANAGPDQIIELTSCDGALVTLDGSQSNDPDGDGLAYAWTWPGGSATGQKPEVMLPMGTTVITLTVDDGKGGTSSDTVKISVNDTIASILKVEVSPNILWPPNHRYVKVTPKVTVTDVCVPKTKIELLSVTSNEPDFNQRAGDRTMKDIVIRPDGSILLRAERDLFGNGRVYSITYVATDMAGNRTTGTAEVRVPKRLNRSDLNNGRWK